MSFAEDDEKWKVKGHKKSVEREMIESRLMALSVGDFVSWDELQKLINKSQRDVAAYTHNARRYLAQEHRAHFAVDHGRGIYRISHAEVAETTIPRATKKMRKAATRSLRIISAVNLDEVAPADRLSVLAHGSVAAFVREATRPKALKILSANVDAKILTPSQAATLLLAQAKKRDEDV